MVFGRLKAANLKPKNSIIEWHNVRSLGHLMSAEGVEPLSDTCKVIQEFPAPANL